MRGSSPAGRGQIGLVPIRASIKPFIALKRLARRGRSGPGSEKKLKRSLLIWDPWRAGSGSGQFLLGLNKKCYELCVADRAETDRANVY